MPYFIALLIVVIALVVANVRIVSQATEYVTEFLGKYKSTWDAGLHVKIPFVEKIVNKVVVKEQIIDSPPQPVITKDNVTMQIDSVVYFRIFDAKMYTYGVVNPIEALANLTATTLRNIVGEMTLDETLTSREVINDKMRILLDEATDQWGIKVNRVELKNIMPPRDIQQSMEKQMKAERDRRETLLQAEGHKQAVVTKAAGDKEAMILQAEGERDARIARAEGEARALLLKKQAEADGLKALMAASPTIPVLELKKYEALVELSKGPASKIIVPTDVVENVKHNVLFSETTGIGDVTEPAPTPVVPEKPDPCCDKFKKDNNATTNKANHYSSMLFKDTVDDFDNIPVDYNAD